MKEVNEKKKQEASKQEPKINFFSIEKKWQKEWEKAKCFSVREDKKKKKYYVLEMYPYPSASFLHMGHVRNYTIGDVYARFKRMQGFNVLYPMGYDSFGLPAETAAKKEGIHPKIYAENSIKKIMEYQKALGNSYDWSRVLASHDPDYYRWNQYFFLKMLEKGLAYRKKAGVNWCEKCESVLANEEAEAGKCWRCGEEVVKKELEQWFLKITAYADKLLEDLNKIEWSERIKLMQKNWIGKSHGVEIDFEITYPKETNFVLLHGYTGSPNANFFPWLKKELENRGYKVNVPELPNTNNPEIEMQAKYVIDNCDINENTILLGHSLGSAVALNVLEKLDEPIKRLVLAAGFAQPGFLDERRPFEKKFNWKFNFESIKKNIKEIRILRAVNDTAVPKERADYLKEKIGGEIIDFHAEDDHICGNEEPEVLNSCLYKWPIFTTRPDTICGVTFMVVSIQHKKLFELVTDKQKKEVENFLKKLKSVSEKELEEMEKEGVFTGSYAINPLTKEKIPIWAGNFVVADYGSGMVMAVPSHDERDFQFAKKYNLAIKVVIQNKEKSLNEKTMKNAYIEEGVLVSSGKFDRINSLEAIGKISEHIEKEKLGRKTINYKIRDWMISRQRYWGTPIPVIYCNECGIAAVPEKELPVLLPEKVKFGEGNPLATNKTFVNAKCPKCGKIGRRETDTMGGFVDSSWYFLRYCDNNNEKEAFNKDKVNYWMPVDQYIGGAEHAVMHLIYARFFTKVLKDLKFLNFDEPFTKLFNQGTLTKGGEKMSKSKGNVVFQTEISDKYGIDTARLFLMFVASPDKQMEWSEEGIEGSFRIINKLIRLRDKIARTSSDLEEHIINKTIKNVSLNIESFDYPKAIISITECIDSLNESIRKENYEVLLKLISVFCPHIAEELWHKIGNKTFISLEEWPKAEQSKIDEKFENEEKQKEKLIEDIRNILKILEARNSLKDKKSIKIFAIPKEIALYKQEEEKIFSIFSLKTEVVSIQEASKTGKVIKAMPGKPGILVE